MSKLRKEKQFLSERRFSVPELAVWLNNLGNLLSNKGDYLGAIELIQEALASWKKSLGNDHPQVATGCSFPRAFFLVARDSR